MELIFLALVFFLAGIGAELVGFGISAISMALLPFLLPLPIAIPLVAVISVVATGVVSFTTKAKGLGKHLLPLFAGSFVGIPIGMYFLASIDEKLLATVLGYLLIAAALYSMFAKKLAFSTAKPLASSIVGLVAGFFGSTLNINGPLVGLHTSYIKRSSADKKKDIVSTYMFITGIFIVVGHSLAGRITPEVIRYSLFSIPFLMLGIYAGTIILKRTKATWIRYAVYIIVLSSGVMLIV